MFAGKSILDSTQAFLLLCLPSEKRIPGGSKIVSKIVFTKTKQARRQKQARKVCVQGRTWLE